MTGGAEVRSAWQRRAWRLALLLTGDASRAGDVVRAARRALRHGAPPDAAQLDRLIIQQLRVAARRRPRTTQPHPQPTDPSARRLLEALHALPQQPREAWVLRRIDRLDERHTARAMDCSRTAAERHLAAADRALTSQLDQTLDAATTALQAWADHLPVDELMEATAARAAHARRRRLAVSVAIGLGVVMLFGLVWLRWAAAP